MIGIIAAVCLITILIFMSALGAIYNKFQKLHNGAEAGLAQIKVALKKRLDLITQLADVVKAYSKFEKSVLKSITNMRSLVNQNIKTDDIENIKDNSNKILKSIFAVAENYPDLKASKNYLELMNSLREVESEILRQRYTYNNIVEDYNTRIGVVPSNIVARVFSYKKLNYLKFEDDFKKNLELEMRK